MVTSNPGITAESKLVDKRACLFVWEPVLPYFIAWSQLSPDWSPSFGLGSGLGFLYENDTTRGIVSFSRPNYRDQMGGTLTCTDNIQISVKSL